MSPVRVALVFGALAVAAAILLTPIVEEAGFRYARTDAYGVDQVVTGSIGTAQKRRYRLQKSVLHPGERRLCMRDQEFGC